MIRIFVILQAVLAIVASVACTPAAVPAFNGLVSAQASLVGVWLSLGESRASVRVITSVAGISWLGWAMMLAPRFNPWELLLLVLQAAIVAFAFWIVRLRSKRILALRKEQKNDSLPFQIHLRHMFGLTFATAVVVTIMTYVQNDSYSLFVFIFLVAAGFALIPIVACWTIFGRGNWLSKAACLTVFTAAIVGALTWTAYLQASRHAAIDWSVTSTVEALWATLSFVALHRMGYRMTQ